MTTFAVNAFCRRQTRESRFSHWNGGEAELLGAVEQLFGRAAPGYRPGVVQVPLPAGMCRSGIIKVTDRMGLAAGWVRRQAVEDPYCLVWAPGASKPEAAVAHAILYAHDVLGAEASTEADWEVVSVNARAELGDEPLPPLTMARNFLEKPGGTRGDFTVEQMAAAVNYWSCRCQTAGDGEALEGPLFPPLTAGVAQPERGPLYLCVWTKDPGVLAPPPAPEPPHPVRLARRAAGHEGGRYPADPRVWAEAIYYWASRPLTDPGLAG